MVIVVAYNIGITIYEAKITSILKTAPAWIEPPTPLFKRPLLTTLAGDGTVDTSGEVINLNMNTAFKCVSHILGNLQLLQTVAELCADGHYGFAEKSDI